MHVIDSASASRGLQGVRVFVQALALLAILALAGASSAASAKADGDPASDVLATQSLFLPQDAAVPTRQATQLAAVLQEAARSGYPIRVALIASSTDLGSITELWNQPQSYAQFLGQELSLVYRGALLVVMPGGLGVYHVGGSAPVERGILSAAGPRAGIGAAALTAIRNLAAAAGHPLALPPAGARGARTSAGSAIPWIAFLIGAMIVAVAWAASLRARPLGVARGKPSSA
jgi:hypothetical protein